MNPTKAHMSEGAMYHGSGASPPGQYEDTMSHVSKETDTCDQ